MSRLIFVVLIVGLLAGCTRVETGHVGVRVQFNGTIEPVELPVGFHQTLVGTVRTYVANEITMQLNDLHPQTKDRTVLQDLDLTYTYSIAPGSIADLVVQYKGRDMVSAEHNDIYPLGLYVQNVVQTSATDVFARYDALAANEAREEIRGKIKERVNQILDEEKLTGKISVHQIFIKNLAVDPKLMNSVLQVIQSQNDLKTKENEVKIADQEAKRLSLLAANANNISYMNAKSLSDIAEGVRTGKVHTIVIPYDFRGLLQLPQK